MVELPTTLTGRLLSSATVRGLAFMATSYSNSPIFAVPDGSTMFCRPRAVTMSDGESPLDCSRRWSRSTMTWRWLPPYVYGMDALVTVPIDVLDVVHRRGEDPLVLRGDPTFHLFRVQAGELPGDRDHRNVDARKDVGRCAADEDRAGEQDQQSQDDEGVGTLQGDSDNPHAVLMPDDPARLPPPASANLHDHVRVLLVEGESEVTPWTS